MTMTRRGIGLAVGVNAVDPGSYSGWEGRLQACEADATAIAALGREQGFEMTTLLTPAATRAALLAALERAAGELRAGDIYLLSYAGHGGQVPDRNGDDADYRDETWCLYDGELIDDELHQQLAMFAAGVRVLVLSDSCHSGTVIRQSGDAPPAGELPAAPAATESGLVSRAMPDDVAVRTYQEHRDFYGGLQQGIPDDITAQIGATVRLISACQDRQVAIDGPDHGLFTGALLRVWNQGAFAGTYRDLHAAIERLMPPTQTPNHLVLGAANASFDAEKPFTI